MSYQHQSRSGCGRMLLVLFGVVFFVVMGLLIWLVYTSRSLEDEIRAKGEPVTLAELDAWYTAVPDEENAALVVLQAATMWQSPSPAAISTIPFHRRTRYEQPDTWDDFGTAMPDRTKVAVAEYLTSNRECLQALLKLDGVTKSRYPVVARTVLGGRLTHLDGIPDLTRLLILDAIYKTEIGDAAGAGASLERAIRASETLKHEPFLISQMVRLACHSLVFSGIQHVVNRVSLPAEQLERLQDLIKSADDPDTIYRALAGERCFTTDGSYPWVPNAILMPIYRGSSTRLFNRAVDASRLTGVQRRKEFDLFDAAATRSINPMAAIVFPAFKRTPEMHDEDIARMRVAAVVLALMRHRLTNGGLPETSSAIDPDFLSVMPIDPFDDQPLRYMRGDFGFLVYSIGTNLRDEQGAEPDKDARMTGDIVIKITR